MLDHVYSSTFQKVVVALVHSRLDYGNGVLVGIPAHLMRRLQSVLNAAARLIFNLKRRLPAPIAWKYLISNFPQSAAELFRLPPHRSGTHYQTQSFRYQHCGRSSTN